MEKVIVKKTKWQAFVLTLSVASTPLYAESLQDAIAQTIKTNPNILVETNERLSRDQELKQAYSGYLPTVNATFGIGVERNDNPSTRANAAAGGHPGTTREFTRHEAGVEFRQMLFDGFATSSEVKRQTARINSQAYRIFGESEATGLRTTEVFMEVLRFERLVALAHKNRDSHKKVFDQIKKRVDVGFGRASDLQQVTGRLALAESNLVADQSNLRDAESNYLRVIGLFPSSLVLPKPPNNLPVNQEDAVEIALANHPVLKSANADIEATYSQRRAARSAHLPRIHLEGASTSHENIDGVDGTNRDDSLMVRLRYNLYNGGRDRARLKQTAELINEAKEVRNNTYRQVIESIRLSWNSHKTLLQQLSFLKLHESSSQKTYDAYKKQFNIGQRTLLDLLDTENELFEAKRAYVNGQFTSLFAQYRILAGTGRLLITLGVELPVEALVIGAGVSGRK